MSSGSGVLGLTAAGQENDYGYGQPVQLTTTYRLETRPHPLNDPNISYGMYSSCPGQERKCCIVKNFSKTWVSAHCDFASFMKKRRFSNLCLEVYAYDQPNDTPICEPFKSTLMSWTEQLLESDELDCWKDEDGIISGQSLLRPLFGFLMVYAPEGYYHPDLLNSAYITDENKVKFLSKEKVLTGRGEYKKNLSEVLSFIYRISTGVTPQQSQGIGNLKFPKSSSQCSAHIPESLRNLYKYLQSYDPFKHHEGFFFDPPFLHGWEDRMRYVHNVYMETCYNPLINDKFTQIINWGRWEKSLSKINDVLKEYEDFRNSKIADGSSSMFHKPHKKNEGMIKYYVNIFKHLHSDLPHTQKARDSADSSASAHNPTPVNDLESIIEKRLNPSGYVYMAVNEYLQMNSQDVAEFSKRILTWQPLGL